jgi:outer membrane protein OmpA-like peptidoglycan-associated protein
MGERALTTSLDDTASLEETEDVARRKRADKAPPAESPAIRLLDALRTGDDAGVHAVCSETTAVSAENMDWSCRGRDFESRTRHIGFGLVIDEARVQDIRADEEAEQPAEASAELHGAARHDADPSPDIHPMWDDEVTERRNLLSLWRESSLEDLSPARLNMPVRVTVRHDDLQVHEITLSFPAALLKRALGMHVDPLEMSLSEVQSAFIAPVGAGFTTYPMARPELTLVRPAQPAPEPWTPETEPPRRHRRRLLAPVLVALVAVVAAGGWWAVQGKDSDLVTSTPAPSPSSTPAPSPSSTPVSQPSASPSQEPPSEAPTVTQAKPSDTPARKPNVTLRSDLAFGFNSSTLSKKAKAAIDDVARQVRKAGLTGKIYVDGYTDNIGSAEYGLVLSRKRADAVSTYLGSRLVGVSVEIVSVAHGEADPVERNSTKAGRKANRRVTITLPKP